MSCSSSKRSAVGATIVAVATALSARDAIAEQPRGDSVDARAGATPIVELSPAGAMLDPKTGSAGAAVGVMLRPVALGRSTVMDVATGYLHELGGDDGVWARVGLVTRVGRVRIEAASTAERMMSPVRDELDVIASASADIAMTRQLAIGAACVVPDIEDAWDSEERDGGARPFAGPTVTLTPIASMRIVAGPALSYMRDGPRVVEHVGVAWSF